MPVLYSEYAMIFFTNAAKTKGVLENV